MHVFRILGTQPLWAGSLTTIQRQKYKPVISPIKNPFSIIPVVLNLVFCRGSVAGSCILDTWAATLVGRVLRYYTEAKSTLSIIFSFIVHCYDCSLVPYICLAKVHSFIFTTGHVSVLPSFFLSIFHSSFISPFHFAIFPFFININPK